jgi:hypothetical protein
MLRPNKAAAAVAVAFAILALAHTASAQTSQVPSVRDSGKVVTVAPAAIYKAGGLKRFLLGSNWRELWTTPIEAPVLDLSTYAGGLKLDGPGGGRQSIVLHLKENDGWKEYRFRSVDKFPEVGAKPLTGTYLARLFRDQVSTHFPAAPLLVPPLHRAIGVLHVTPELYVMGDSPRLEQLRDTAAGMMGTMELKGEEAPDDKPGFAGSTSIKGTEKFIEDLESGRDHLADERELLAIRLVDLLINDSDRTPDNFDWARFGDKGNYTWRPLPRDRDHAFKDANGLLNRLVVKSHYPKQAPFTTRYGLNGLLYGTHQIDRRFLQRLTAQDFADVGSKVQRAITDSVIGEVIAAMPAAWREKTTEDDRIRSVLRARRDQIEQISADFYRTLAREVDVFGTNEADRFEVVRHGDGSVTVVITDPERKLLVERRSDGRSVTTSDGEVVGSAERAPYYSRTFIPTETKEVRLYALGENDIAIVRGTPNDAIKIRVIGGKGDDFLADSAGGDATYLYDAEGRNVLQLGDETRVSTAPWKQLTALAGLRVAGGWVPDWGGSKGWSPAIDYNTGSGIIVGFGPKAKRYGFRRIPNEWEAKATGWVGTMNGRVGLTSKAEYHLENSPQSFRVDGQATQLEATRFFGYGNSSPRIDRRSNLVDQTIYSVEPAYVYHIGWRTREKEGNVLRGIDSTKGRRPIVGKVSVGSFLGYFDPEPTAGSALQLSGVHGSEAFGVAGARVGLEVDGTDDDPIPSEGFKAEVQLGGYPPLFDLDGAFGTASARTSFYVPLIKKGGPVLALRAGGSLAAGDYPAQFAAFVGGRSSLRGFSYRRFAGDMGANGSAELRLPVGDMNFIVRSKVGVFGLADAGRVWFDGASDGGWHTAFGGGVWASAFGQALSLAYAKGESQRIYIKSGLFF